MNLKSKPNCRHFGSLWLGHFESKHNETHLHQTYLQNLKPHNIDALMPTPLLEILFISNSIDESVKHSSKGLLYSHPYSNSIKLKPAYNL